MNPCEYTRPAYLIYSMPGICGQFERRRQWGEKYVKACI